MINIIKRTKGTADWTIGSWYIDRIRRAFTLEDEKRTVHVPGETRIPAGKYKMQWQKKENDLTTTYRRRFPWFQWHMEIVGIPKFRSVEILIGSTDEHSDDGEILVGNIVDIETGQIWSKTPGGAYEEIYGLLKPALDAGPVDIEIIDED